MAVKKVEYIFDSSTNGFAIAGDSVDIKPDSASTIKKDVDAGNTKPLNLFQSIYLDDAIESGESDNTDYETSDEGDAAAETEVTEEGENLKKGNGTVVAAAAQSLFGQAILMANTAMMPAMNAVSAPVIGKAEVAMSALGLANALAFDPDFIDRMSEASSKDDYSSELDVSLEAINADLEELTNNDTLVQLQTKNDKYKELSEAGNKEEADALLPEIEELRSKLTEGNSAIDVDVINENNLKAHESFEKSTSVAEFLKEGIPLGAMATFNTATLTANAFISTTMSAMAWIGVTPLTPWLVPSAVAGEVMSHIATGIFAGSAVAMGAKAVGEFVCGAKGNSLASKVSEVDSPLAQHDEVAESLGVFEEVAQETESAADGTDESAAGGEGGSSEGAGAGAVAGASSGNSSGSSNNSAA